MLDVGSNFGYYALLAAKMGCRVLAWEPVPVFRAFIELAAQLNNVSHLIHVRRTIPNPNPNPHPNQVSHLIHVRHAVVSDT